MEEIDYLSSKKTDTNTELTEINLGLRKGFLGMIPHIGSMLNEIIYEIPSRIHQSRINEMVKILSSKMDNIENSFINSEYLKSEDFFDFSRATFNGNLSIKINEKRNALASIYVESILEQADYDISKNKLFIEFIIKLSPIQINILSFIEHNTPLLDEVERYDKFYDFYLKSSLSFSIEKYEFKFYCNELEKMSLISLGDGLEDFDSKTVFVVASDHKKPSVFITDFGNEFVKYLKQK